MKQLLNLGPPTMLTNNLLIQQLPSLERYVESTSVYIIKAVRGTNMTHFHVASYAFYSAFGPLFRFCSLQLVWLYGALGFRFSILYVIICRRQNRWNWIASCHDSANALTPPKPFGYASADLCHTSPPASTPHNTILCGTNCATLCGTTTIQKYFYHFFYFFQYF